ncbi:MAG: hypothetical protein GX307_00610 [Euryarchaeota archaeon]|nr:hypothetical protein [Euryarchaeota archaeon]
MTGDATISMMSMWEGHVQKEADREVLGLGDRAGNIVAIPFIVLVVAILLYLQGRGYIFTSEFNAVDEILFYGSLLFGIIPNVVRATTARRNLGRFFDIIGSLIFIAVGTYLLMKFPFDFDNLYLIAPQELQFALQWISNSIVKILLGLAIFITSLSVIYNGILLIAVRDELIRRRMGAPRPPQ